MSTFKPSALLSIGAALAMIGAGACGGGSGGATPGSGGTAGGTGGSSGSGGSSPGGGSGGAVPGGGPDGSTGACEPKSVFTLAVHVAVKVSWPDSIGADGGNGTVDIWNLVKLTATGTALASVTQPCGSTLPELTLKPLIGGGKTLLEVPNSVWDAPMAPKVPSTGTLAGWTVGSALSTEVTNVLVGMTMPDPNGAWPASRADVTAVDSDGDGQPGITSVPRTGAGYVQPPVALALVGLGAKADKVNLASRTAVALNGALTSCTEAAGTATVKFFDSRVVGCHVAGGSECTPMQIDFIDMSLVPFTIAGGTFQSKLLAEGATCADARAAMGQQP